MASTGSSAAPPDKILKQMLRIAARAFLYTLPVIALVWGAWVLCRNVLQINPGPIWGFVGILLVLVTAMAMFIHLRRRDPGRQKYQQNDEEE